MQSLSLRNDKPLNPDKFFPWIQDLVAVDGPNILRCKGILSFKDDPERFVFQGVHMILDGDHQRAWKADEKRESRIIFIGRQLPQDKIRQGFEACVAVNRPNILIQSSPRQGRWRSPVRRVVSIWQRRCCLCAMFIRRGQGYGPPPSAGDELARQDGKVTA